MNSKTNSHSQQANELGFEHVQPGHHALQEEWVLELEVHCEKNIDIYNQSPSLSI